MEDELVLYGSTADCYLKSRARPYLVYGRSAERYLGDACVPDRHYIENWGPLFARLKIIAMTLPGGVVLFLTRKLLAGC